MRFFLAFLNLVFIMLLSNACSEKEGATPVSPLEMRGLTLDGREWSAHLAGARRKPTIRAAFSEPVARNSAAEAFQLTEPSGAPIPLDLAFDRGDSVVVLTPSVTLQPLASHRLTLDGRLKSASGNAFNAIISRTFSTHIDSSRKFPPISDDSLLTLVQRQTFRYFWDFGHPVSGLARERNSSGDLVTSGGSGFGIMAIPVAVHRNFVTRAEGLARMKKIVDFLKNTAVRVKGAYPHWLNGATGAVIPFSANDNGADLVETSYLVMGLLTARQFFDGTGSEEKSLRADIDTLYRQVQWDWFRNNGQDALYWHYSPDKAWVMNMRIRGWNECLITYVLAASSPSYGIPKSVYNAGWADNGRPGFVNGNAYYGINLPLGPAYGGPLFFSHYSFMGIDPRGLSDAYADYGVQTRNHSLINQAYCKTNPKGYYGYSDSCWGLTASDISNGYTASSPTNDVGVIAPTAALSSMPFTPAESMKALRFFYHTLGDRLWKDYGFIDAFSLNQGWFANSFLAIDQGPIIVMIENHRSGLPWRLFMSAPEVREGLRKLDFKGF
jgi:hypothetical protein